MKQIVRAGTLLCIMVAQYQAISQQPSAPSAPAQTIPDAPKPQATLPNLNSITPGKGTTLYTNGDATVTGPNGGPNGGQVSGQNSSQPDADAPPSTLAPAAPTVHSDDGEAPEIVPQGQGAKVFSLPSVTVNFVQIPFTVKDSKGRLVPGITWRDVRVYENGLRQQVKYWTTDPFPLSVALVIDQSVTFDTMTKINNSLGALQSAFSAYDQVAVFTYNNGTQMQTDFTAAQSARLGAVLERSKGKGREPLMGLGGPLAQTTVINNQQFDPNTAAVRNNPGITINVPREYHTLNDAILEAAVALQKSGTGRRRIVYVISDGKEYGSQAKEKDVIKYLQTHQIAVYATLVGDTAVPGLGFLDRFHLPMEMRDDVLPRYTSATGGGVDPEFRTRGIERSFAKITEEVRTQYTIGYYTHEPFIDGKYRKVEVRVLRPNLTVMAKEGYYPSATQGARPITVPPAAQPKSSSVSTAPASQPPA